MPKTTAPIDQFTHAVRQRLASFTDPLPDVPTVVRHAQRRRTVSLRRASNGELQLRIPARLSARRFSAWLIEHHTWLVRSIAHLARTVPSVIACAIAQGAQLPVCGVLVPVEFAPSARTTPRATITDRAIIIAWPSSRPIADDATLRALVHGAYRRAASAAWEARIHAGADQLGVPRLRLRINDSLHRWGSCSPRGIIRLSWRLFAAPPWVAEYVIWHELCHVRHMNHAPAFWALLREYNHDIDRANAWFRCCGSTLRQVLGARCAKISRQN